MGSEFICISPELFSAFHFTSFSSINKTSTKNGTNGISLDQSRKWDITGKSHSVIYQCPGKSNCEVKLMTQTRFTKNENALSPVVAVIIMVAVTIVLAAVLYTWGLHFCRNDKQTPTVGAVYHHFEGNNSAVYIEKVDPDAVSVISVNYILLDSHGTAVPGVQGSVKDIYWRNEDFEQTNVSFKDNDLDGKVSAGDVFIILSKENGGQAESGYSLLLKFDPTGDKMNGGGTMLG